jgi:hypothetical protein
VSTRAPSDVRQGLNRWLMEWYWVMSMSIASSLVYQAYVLYWFADGLGRYSRFFNVVCTSQHL